MNRWGIVLGISEDICLNYFRYRWRIKANIDLIHDDNLTHNAKAQINIYL